MKISSQISNWVKSFKNYLIKKLGGFTRDVHIEVSNHSDCIETIYVSISVPFNDLGGLDSKFRGQCIKQLLCNEIARELVEINLVTYQSQDSLISDTKEIKSEVHIIPPLGDCIIKDPWE